MARAHVRTEGNADGCTRRNGAYAPYDDREGREEDPVLGTVIVAGPAVREDTSRSSPERASANEEK